jgi:hypothetical protein
MERCLAGEADGEQGRKAISRGKPKFHLRSVSWTDFVDLLPRQEQRSINCARLRALVDEKPATRLALLTIGLASEAALQGRASKHPRSRAIVI